MEPLGEHDRRKDISDEELRELLAVANGHPHVIDPERWVVRTDGGPTRIDWGRPHWDWRFNLRLAWGELTPWRESRKHGSGLAWLRNLPYEGKPRPVRWLLERAPNPRRALSWLVHTDPNRPDCTVNGSIIAFWHEDGQHIAAFDPDTCAQIAREAIAGREALRTIEALRAWAERQEWVHPDMVLEILDHGGVPEGRG